MGLDAVSSIPVSASKLYIYNRDFAAAEKQKFDLTTETEILLVMDLFQVKEKRLENTKGKIQEFSIRKDKETEEDSPC